MSIDSTCAMEDDALLHFLDKHSGGNYVLEKGNLKDASVRSNAPVFCPIPFIPLASFLITITFVYVQCRRYKGQKYISVSMPHPMM